MVIGFCGTVCLCGPVIHLTASTGQHQPTQVPFYVFQHGEGSNVYLAIHSTPAGHGRPPTPSTYQQAVDNWLSTYLPVC